MSAGGGSAARADAANRSGTRTAAVRDRIVRVSMRCLLRWLLARACVQRSTYEAAPDGGSRQGREPPGPAGESHSSIAVLDRSADSSDRDRAATPLSAVELRARLVTPLQTCTRRDDNDHSPTAEPLDEASRAGVSRWR